MNAGDIENGFWLAGNLEGFAASADCPERMRAKIAAAADLLTTALHLAPADVPQPLSIARHWLPPRANGKPPCVETVRKYITEGFDGCRLRAMRGPGYGRPYLVTRADCRLFLAELRATPIEQLGATAEQLAEFEAAAKRGS